MAVNGSAVRGQWSLDWTDADIPVQTGVYNERNLALLFGLEQQGVANRDKEFDKVYLQVGKLPPAELGDYWTARSARYALLNRTEPKGSSQPGGATILMVLIYEGRLDAAKAVASASPPEHLTYRQAERFGAPIGALCALAQAAWPRLASAAEHDARETLRLDVLAILQQAARDDLQPPEAAADALVVACGNGTLPWAFLDALLSAVQMDEAVLRAAVAATAKAGNARVFSWLISKGDDAGGGVQRARNIAASHAIEIALAASAEPAGSGCDHGLWMRCMLRYVGRGAGPAGKGSCELDVLTAARRPPDDAVRADENLISLARAPPESVLQALVHVQPATVRWLLDGARPESDSAIAIFGDDPPKKEALFDAATIVSYLVRPMATGSVDKSWLAHLGTASFSGLLTGGPEGPLGAPVVARTIDASWQIYAASRMIYTHGAISIACAIGLTLHLSLAYARAEDANTDGYRTHRVIVEATTIAVPIALISAWQLYRGCVHAMADPMIGLRLAQASRARTGQLITAAAVLLALALEAVTGARKASLLLGLAAALSWLRTVEIATATTRGSTVLALLLLSTHHIPLALGIACPIALAVSLVSDALIGAPPSLVNTLLPAVGLASGLAAALSVALTASDDNVLVMGARMVRLRQLVCVDTGMERAALDEARAKVKTMSNGKALADEASDAESGVVVTTAGPAAAVELL